MSFGLEKSTLHGRVDELMKDASALAFHQPWYTPIATSPRTTGMSVGGMGTAFSQTPAGNTPSLSWFPGLFVTGEDGGDPLPLSRFFFSERKLIHLADNLAIPDAAVFTLALTTLRIQRPDGKLWFPEADTGKNQQDVVKQILDTPSFWMDNRQNFGRWQTVFSKRTCALCEEPCTDTRLRNACILLDACRGALISTPQSSYCLEGDNATPVVCGLHGYPADAMDYAALYPLAQTNYLGTDHCCSIRRMVFSPVLPDEEKLCSLPLSFQRFELSNPTDETLEVTLIQFLPNPCGYGVKKARPGVQDAHFFLKPLANFQQGEFFEEDNFCGFELSQKEGRESGDLRGRLALSVFPHGVKKGLSISSTPMFYLDKEEQVVTCAMGTGHLDSYFHKGVYSGRELLAAALCVNVELAPSETRTLDFCLVADFPEIDFPGFSSAKKYTSFYPNTQTRARDILRDYAEEGEKILAKVADFHGTMASEFLDSPVWEKAGKEVSARAVTQLINTLSFLPDATVWDVKDRFWVRECADYPFFNSLDVYFYGSFAILRLLPRLDGCTLREFGRAILAADPTLRRHNDYVDLPWCDLPEKKLEGPRAVRGAVIHDLGSPFDPQPDAYDWHNVKEWKDLAPKYILMVLRHHVLCGDRSILEDCREAVEACLDRLISLIPEGENIPLTHGTDDTFDNLSSHGISVYCGSLWVAGLQAAAKIFDLLGDSKRSYDCTARAEASGMDLNRCLWDEEEGYCHFYHTPLTLEDFSPSDFSELQKRCSGLLSAPAKNALEWKNFVNRWLDENPQIEKRRAKKEALLKAGDDLWKDSFRKKIDLDRDEVFADQLLADTFCELLELPGVFDAEKRQRILEKIVAVSLRKNSPGVPNLVGRRGETLEAFQAQDIWMGVQFSLAGAMILSDMDSDAVGLIETAYSCLYERARIPFAAPEGFNASCPSEISEGHVLKFTAGRYFRPSMIYVLPLLQKCVAKRQEGRYV